MDVCRTDSRIHEQPAYFTNNVYMDSGTFLEDKSQEEERTIVIRIDVSDFDSFAIF